ncbi:hypothetical protein GOP47_0002028 [Adiantum capillus-veneris]|uniref:Glycosyl transferase 64 domain-containing protein n=1 Tax=Adiantum capillus-veneris TaxID=13818 RepID=A0A9D4ZR88_ADICA|nr:hypothetical protein GOP47_0002028 [Adiantum capillus-veneris]
MRGAPHRWRYRHVLWLIGGRIHFMMGICALLAFILLLCHTSSLMGWHRHTKKGNNHERFTVLVNTWRRPDLLKKSVQHYSQCPNVHSIRVVWSESREPPSPLLFTALQASVKKASKKLSYPIKLKIDMHQEDNLNTRFQPLDNLATRAIFSVDDDVLVPCNTLGFAFTVWLSAHDSMVGFVPRMHWLHGKESFNQPVYTYGGWWSVWWTGTYSMVLSKCAIFHKKYLDLYTNHMPAKIRDYVTRKRNCEDIAMSFLVANLTKAPPIWVKGKIFEIGSSGISSLSGHSEHRSSCLNAFVDMYGHMPLVSSNFKAMDARSTWIW